MRIMLALLLLIPTAGCLHNEGPARIPADQAKTRLVFFNNNQKLDNEFTAATSLNADERRTEKSLLDYCGLQPKAAVEAMVLGYLIDKGVSFLVDRADKALQDEIAKYTAAYEASATLNFYEGGGSLTLANKCLRVTRISDDDKKLVLMDYLAGFELDRNERLRIRPLRLYYAHPAVKTDASGKYGISAKLKLHITWRQDNRSLVQSDYPDIALLSEKIVFKDKAYFYKSYYDPLKPEESPSVLAPLPPWSVYGVTQYGGNLTAATVSVAEAGHVPKLLEKAAELFADKKDKIEEQVKDALNKAAGLE